MSREFSGVCILQVLTMNFYHLSNRFVFKQLSQDLIGKDSHRGVTLTYAWLANQFGHISLGLIPSLIVFSILKEFWAYESADVIASLSVSLAWLVFELFNFLWPLLRGKKRYTFSPDYRNIGFDTFIDLCFFWFGASTLSLFLEFTYANLIIELILLVIILIFGRYWYETKMYLNYANSPFQFRLSQWNLPMNDANKEKLDTFMKLQHKGKHLLVFGSKGTGKTSLGVGILNEMSIKHQFCTYTTSIKVLSLQSWKQKLHNVKNEIWDWQDAQYLVIDDINPGSPLNKEVITTKDFLKRLSVSHADTKNEAEIKKNQELFRNKNVIWILGDTKISESDEWKEMLLGIGIPSNLIYTVDLDQA